MKELPHKILLFNKKIKILYRFEVSILLTFFITEMRKLSIIVLIIMQCFYALADNDQAAKTKKTYPFNYGVLTDSAYSNPYFGIHLQFPADWIIQNKTQIQNIFEIGKKAIEFNDEASNKYMESIDVNSMTLLMLAKYEYGSPVEFNPSLILMAENIINFPGIKKGSDYHFHLTKLLKESNLDMEVVNSDDSIPTNKHTFYVLECVRNASGIHLEYYTAIINKFAVSFVIAYKEDDDKNRLLKIIHSLKFDKSE